MSKEFGKRLAQLRKAAGYGQQAFQQLCGWGDGTNNSRISMYEVGKNEPTLADIEVMAVVLDVSPAHLAYGSPDTLSPDELKLVSTFRRTNDQGRQAMLAIAEAQPSEDASAEGAAKQKMRRASSKNKTLQLEIEHGTDASKKSQPRKSQGVVGAQRDPVG